MRIGIDLGGTKIEGIVLDRDGRERQRRRVATPQGDYRGALESVAAVVGSLETAAGEPCTVGIGMPGSLSPVSGLVRNSNSTCLNHRPFREDIQDLLGRPVRLANDANCFALSEASDGAGAGADVVFGVILGTGVGGGLVVHGRLIEGANLIGGEWGHNPLPAAEGVERPGPRCFCGRSGCIEAFLCGPGLMRDHESVTGQHLATAAIVAAAESGDDTAEATLRRYEDRLARSLAAVINLVDPQVIVLGGGLSNLERLYRNVPAAWPPHIFSDVVTTRLVPAAYGDSSGVRGAAWLWPSEVSTTPVAGPPGS